MARWSVYGSYKMARWSVHVYLLILVSCGCAQSSTLRDIVLYRMLPFVDQKSPEGDAPATISTRISVTPSLAASPVTSFVMSPTLLTTSLDDDIEAVLVEEGRSSAKPSTSLAPFLVREGVVSDMRGGVVFDTAEGVTSSNARALSQPPRDVNVSHPLLISSTTSSAVESPAPPATLQGNDSSDPLSVTESPESTRPPLPGYLTQTSHGFFNDSLGCRVLETAATWLRHPGNCSRYFVCRGGQVQEMPPCDAGQVFSIRTKRCVPPHTLDDDCEEMFFSFPTPLTPPSTSQLSGTLLWHQQYSQDRDATPRIVLQPTPLMEVSTEEASTEKNYDSSMQMSVKSTRVCGPLQKGVYPHPDNCAWFYNCSVAPDAVMDTYYGGYVMECPYPQLFSLTSLQCEDFEDVDCRGRYEPVSPCDYRANHCHETSHCIPCWVRYATCRGQQDGLNPWPELEWRPFFVECYRERTVFQGSCDKSSVFSPLTRACETPYSIPREHGGWRPSCQGRLDGKYPDEHGRCESFYTCAKQIFTGYYNCPPSLIFDYVTGSCQSRWKVHYPCGDKDIPNVCSAKTDGQYLDGWGRCTHYYTCKEGTFQGMSLCPDGVFNPRTRMCDRSADMASPCGTMPNPCLDKTNGFYSVTQSCREYYLCDNGLQVALFSCEDNTVFNEATQSCDDVTDTPPPCGLAPWCVGRPDGRYPALGLGLHVFYTCLNGSFTGLTLCTHTTGGLAYSAFRRQCTTPASVCKEMLGDSGLC